MQAPVRMRSRRTAGSCVRRRNQNGDATVCDASRPQRIFDDPQAASDSFYCPIFIHAVWCRCGQALFPAETESGGAAISNGYVISGTDSYRWVSERWRCADIWIRIAERTGLVLQSA